MLSSSIASAIAAYRQPLQAGQASATTDAKGTSFADTLGTMLTDTVNTMKESEQLAGQAAMGKANLQEVVIAVSNAEVMMQTVSSIRDKIVTAYQDIMRTSV